MSRTSITGSINYPLLGMLIQEKIKEDGRAQRVISYELNIPEADLSSAKRGERRFGERSFEILCTWLGQAPEDLLYQPEAHQNQKHAEETVKNESAMEIKKHALNMSLTLVAGRRLNHEEISNYEEEVVKCADRLLNWMLS